MPYIAGSLHLIIAVFFAAHALKTGRSTYWIMILLAFPLIGSAAYLFMEYLPDIRMTRGGRKVLRAVTSAVNPHGDIRHAEQEFERSPTAANRAALALALSEAGRYLEAIEHYEQCASGSYAKDTHFVRCLANANMMAERWAPARAGFDRLFALIGEERKPDDDLGYAYVLSQLGDASTDDAFGRAMRSAVGPVASCRYAQFLETQGRTREARELFEAVVKQGKLAPRHTVDMHKAWYKLAGEAAVRLNAK